jgi:lipopolysaccharide export LptBFGC system permease protein LptF
MENKNTAEDNKYNVNLIFIYFFIAFLILYTIFTIDQLFILLKALNNYSNNLKLMIFSIPAIIVTSIPFSVCIGFTQGLIKINILEKLFQNKNILMRLIIYGIILSMIIFIISDFIMPKSIENFSIMYSKTLIEEEIDNNFRKSPREMSSFEIIKNISKNEINKRMYNIYLTELSKKYSYAFSALVFTFFSLSLSIKYQKHRITALLICVISCFVYYYLLLFCQIFSMRIERCVFLLMWLPNILFIIISFILYISMLKKRER